MTLRFVGKVDWKLNITNYYVNQEAHLGAVASLPGSQIVVDAHFC